MSIVKKALTSLFFIFLAFDIVNIVGDFPFRMVSKPTIMTLLMIYYIVFSPKASSIILTALIFSLFGDIFLLFDQGFLLGMASFFITHLLYSVYFSFQKDKLYRDHFIGMGLLGVLLAAFWYVVGPTVPGEFKIPMIAYSGILAMMVLFALMRRRIVRGYGRVLQGSILFLISDFCIAIDTFYKDHSLFDPIIMMLYGLGQFLIIDGIIQYQQTQVKKEKGSTPLPS